MSRYLIISELQHFLVTLVIAFFLYRRYRDWRLIPVCFFFGFFIDIDHWFDYLVYFGLNINFSNFFNPGSYMRPSGKIYVPLHGWEFIPIFGLVGMFFEKRWKLPGLIWAMVFSYTGHLLLDSFTFNHHPLAYSFIFRFLNNFSLEWFNRF